MLRMILKSTDKRHIRQACKPADEVKNLIAEPVNRRVENSYIKENKKTDEEIHLISVKTQQPCQVKIRTEPLSRQEAESG